MKSDKPLTQPEQLFKKVRMQFLSLYSSEFKLLCHILLESCDYAWKDDKIVSTHECDSPTQLTEDGWLSFRHSDKPPTGWGDISEERGLLFHIPETVSSDWCREIRMFLYRFNKLVENPAYKRYLAAYHELSGMGKEYRDATFDRAWNGFQEAKRLIAKHQIAERIRQIETDRETAHRPKPPRAIEKGTLVRLKTGSQTATVLNASLTFGNQVVNGACFLSSKLGGTKYWNKDDLTFAD
jgi:hypothetical protein